MARSPSETMPTGRQGNRVARHHLSNRLGHRWSLLLLALVAPLSVRAGFYRLRLVGSYLARKVKEVPHVENTADLADLLLE
jgi:hypothetical protein